MKTQEKSKKRLPRRGSALMMVVFTLFLVMLVVSAIHSLAKYNLLNVSGDYWDDKANYAAKAGVEHAISKLTQDPTFGDPLDTITGTMEDEPDVSYEVEVLNNQTTDTYLTAPDGLEIPPRVVWLRSTGKLTDRAGESTSSLIRLVGYQRPVLKQAIFGIEDVLVDVSSVVRGWEIGPPDVDLTSRGDLGTNSTLANKIVIAGGSTVHGEARAGVGTVNENVVIKENSGGDLTGAKLISEEATQVPRFILPADFFKHEIIVSPGYGPPEDTSRNYFHGHDSLSALPGGTTASGITEVSPAAAATHSAFVEAAPPAEVDGRIFLGRGFYNVPPAGLILDDVLLRRGLYYFNGDLTLRGRISIDPNITGDDPTVIYVNGNVTVEDGAQLNWDGGAGEPLSPRNLQIYTLLEPGEDFRLPADQHSITIGDAEVSAVLVGPNLNVSMDNTEFYGGVQAFTATLTNSTHAFFDVDLYGVPLEGRGEMAVLLNTVQVYAPDTGTGSAVGPTTGPTVGPGPSGPSGPSGPGPAGCDPMPPYPPADCML